MTKTARVPAPVGPPPVRTGTITRWSDTSGLVTADDDVTWFVSRDQLPEGLDELPEGTRIAWQGAPRRTAGKPYPYAQHIRILPEDT